MDFQLLQTKLFAPPTRPEYIPRPRLFDYLDRGFQRKMTLLSAPAGFGKTSVLAGWIHQNHIPVGWLSIDEEENELRHFIAYFISAARAVHPDIGEGALALLEIKQQKTQRVILDSLINDLLLVDRHFALVLDDYHQIHSEDVHTTLGYIIEHMPEWVHIFITTRSDPPIPHLSLLRGRDELIELRTDQLRFNKREIIDFIKNTRGWSLSDGDADLLNKLTEGWISGIQMVAISIKNQVEIPALLHDFSRSNRHILDYLSDEVLNRQPEIIQRFLMVSSLLERMSGTLCDSLLLDDAEKSPPGWEFSPGDGGRFIIDLERRNLFITPLDENRQWYRYHQLFRDLLRQRLDHNHPELIPKLHQRAAAWYQAQQMIPEAINHFLACKKYKIAVKLIVEAAEIMLMRSDFSTLKTWIDALPEELMSGNPDLQIYYLYTSIYAGMPAEKVFEWIDKIQKFDTQGKYRGDILAIQSLIAAFRQDIHNSAELAQKALDCLPQDRIFFRSTVLGHLGFAYLVSGNMQAAKQTLEEARRVSFLVGNLTNYTFALSHLADIAALEARFNDAEGYYQQIFALDKPGEGRTHPILGLAYIGLGAIQRERGQFGEALENLNHGIELVQRFAPSGAIQGYINLAGIYQLIDDPTAADSALVTASQLAMRFEAMEADTMFVKCHQAKMQIIRGNPIQAIQILNIDPQTPSTQLERSLCQINQQQLQNSNKLISYILVAQAFFILERFEISDCMFSKAIEAARSKGWRRVEMGIRVYQVETLNKRGHPDQALECFKPILAIAAKEGILNDFIERGPRIVALLKRALHARVEPDFVTRVLERILASNISFDIRLPSPAPGQELVEPLSEREKTILHYLKSHLTTSEIAQELTLSVHTVRAHVKNIYKKLQVNSRNQAVERAGELGIE